MAIDDKSLMSAEIEVGGGQQVGHIIDALVGALHETGENHPARRQVVFLQSQDMQIGAVGLKFICVGLEEINVGIIQRLKIAVQKPAGNFPIERMLRILPGLKHVRFNLGDVDVSRVGCVRRRHGKDRLCIVG